MKIYDFLTRLKHFFWFDLLSELYLDKDMECYKALNYQRFSFFDLMKRLLSFNFKTRKAKVIIFYLEQSYVVRNEIFYPNNIGRWNEHKRRHEGRW